MSYKNLTLFGLSDLRVCGPVKKASLGSGRQRINKSSVLSYTVRNMRSILSQMEVQAVPAQPVCRCGFSRWAGGAIQGKGLGYIQAAEN